jgi:hypothetical protein
VIPCPGCLVVWCAVVSKQGSSSGRKRLASFVTGPFPPRGKLGTPGCERKKKKRGYCDRPRPGARLGRERFEDEGNNAKKHVGPDLACPVAGVSARFGVAYSHALPERLASHSTVQTHIPGRRRFRTVPQSQSRLHHMVFRFQISKPARELGREIRLQGVSFPRKGRERGAGQTSGSWDGTNGWKYTRTDDGGWSMITMDVLLGVDVTPASRFVLLKFERSPGA